MTGIDRGADGAFDADALIVGGGPSGLSLATELALRGRRSIVVERNAREGVQPRAKTTNVRTMTQMRRWGLAPQVRANRPLPDDFPRRVSFQTSPFRDPVHSFEDAFCASPIRRDAFPEHAEFIPQYVIERILARHVAENPLSDLRFGCRMVDFAQDAAGVSVQVEDKDGPRTFRARYLIGADGARSHVRAKLGIEMRGKRDLIRFASLILRIPGLLDDPDLRKALFHWIVTPQSACIIGPMDTNDLWFWARPAPETAPETAPEAPDIETLLADVRRALGRDFPVEVVSRDSWVVHSLVAERYRDGRAFLIGDACHLHSPFGGHGMNLGVGDAADLGWKLAAALEGWGADGLLDSYGLERRQAHEAVIESATKNVASLSDQFADPALAEDGPEGETARARAAEAIETLKAPEFRSLGLVLGYRYGRSPALAPAPDPEPPLEVTEYRPSARPGHLAPHAWLSETESLYDRLGPGFTLLVLNGGEAASRPFLDAATAQGLPVRAEVLSDPGLRALYGAGYCLVRPDQHVAWRGDAPPSPEALIPVMRGQGWGDEAAGRKSA